MLFAGMCFRSCFFCVFRAVFFVFFFDVFTRVFVFLDEIGVLGTVFFVFFELFF